MKRLYTGDSLDVQVLQSELEEQGIRTAILNEATGGALGGLPFTVAYPELWLANDEDEPRAREIAERFVAEKDQVVEIDPRTDPEAKCRACGYLLYKLPERRCPECGTTF
jgi:hypothetical protein